MMEGFEGGGPAMVPYHARGRITTGVQNTSREEEGVLALRVVQSRHKKMSPERWQQIQGVFDKARSCGPNERRALLDEACTGDKELRAEVEWMLTHQDEAENLMPA